VWAQTLGRRHAAACSISTHNNSHTFMLATWQLSAQHGGMQVIVVLQTCMVAWVHYSPSSEVLADTHRYTSSGLKSGSCSFR